VREEREREREEALLFEDYSSLSHEEREEDGFSKSSSPSFSDPNLSPGSSISFFFYNFIAEEEEQGNEDVEWSPRPRTTKTNVRVKSSFFA
jgi:hypothetical protein